MKKKVLFIINPKAGQGKIKSALLEILELLSGADYEVTVYTTRGPRDATEAVLEYQGKVDLFLCSGGDGTLDEVVTGLVRSQTDTPVGYFPAGSTNDFANSLFMPKDPVAVARNILQGNYYHCDIGRFNDRTFTYVAAFGLFTDVSYQTPQNLKNILGHLAYLLEGTSRLFDIHSYRMRVTANGHQMERDFIYGMVSNSRSIGGMKNLTKKVDMDDGLFEVMLIEMPKNPIELQQIIGALMLGDDTISQIHTFKTRRVTFASDTEVDWTLDGEFGGTHQLVEIENHHQALKLALTSTKQPNEYLL